MVFNGCTGTGTGAVGLFCSDRGFLEVLVMLSWSFAGVFKSVLKGVSEDVLVGVLESVSECIDQCLDGSVACDNRAPYLH